jgi:hypothetical protein
MGYCEYHRDGNSSGITELTQFVPQRSRHLAPDRHHLHHLALPHRLCYQICLPKLYRMAYIG